MSLYVEKVLDDVRLKNSGEPEFFQAVDEVLSALKPVVEKKRGL